MTTSTLRTLALSLLLLSPALASAAEGSARTRTELLISTFKKVKSDAPAGANESLYKELDALIDYDAAIDRAIQTRASKLTPQQKADFKARFRSLIRDVAYPSSGKFFRKAKLTLDPKAADETTSTLRARVPEEDLEANLTLKWAKSADGQLKVVDVLFDGDSMVQDYQNQFAGVIDREGVLGLFKKLEERRAALQKGASAVRRFAALAGGLLLLASSAFAEPAAAPVRTVDDLVELALGGSGQIAEAQGKVEEWRGRLAEVQSLYYPKLSARGWAAPMYRVDRDSVTNDPFKGVDTDWGEWGPYLHLEATLAQPLYTFGRVAAGKDAAEKRLAVEEARARQTRNTVAFEVRKLYYQHLFARSIQPTLANARKILDQALQQGREQYDAGTGKITVVSLQQLEYGSAELDKYIYLARRGEALSLAALKHTIGLPESAELVLADQVLPELESDALPSLPELLQVASRERPEWAQVRSGKQAAISAEAAERLANAPVAFAAGQIRADYTPMRPNASNPYFNDPYNGFWGGIAVGLQWDLDPFRAKARGDAAAGVRVQVEGLEKFASTGIPLEVTKAWGDALEAQSMLEIAERASTAGRKWLTFAGSAYSAGTGDPKAVLEGLASYLQGRRSWYEQLQAVHTARAYLLYATGRTGLEGRK